jgi:membrane protein
MATIAAPPPIPGRPTDPPPKDTPQIVETIDEKSDVAGIAYRAFSRFSFAKATLLAAGTTYYLFLAMFALLAFAFGVAAAFGTEQFTVYLTDALHEALPGLVGSDGIDPAQLRAVGRSSSIIGLLLLLYAGGGAMGAASGSMHLIYGAPPDPRNLLTSRARHLGLLVVIAPLILVSFAIPNLVASATRNATNLVSSSSVPPVLVNAGALLLAFVIDFVIMYILLGVLGGIRPVRHARVIGAATGAVVVSILKYFMGLIIAWSIAKPQYGTFAMPITVLFVLYLLTLSLYGSASLTAGIADRDVPLDELTPGDPEGETLT